MRNWRVGWYDTFSALWTERRSVFYFSYLFIFITGGQPKDNPRFFCRVILDLAQYFHSASSRKCHQMSPREVTFSLDEREVTWLCFHAFQSCLRKKQSRYGELLKFLRKGLSQLRLPAEDFKAVIDTSKHAIFKLIRWKHMQASCSNGTLSSQWPIYSSSDTLDHKCVLQSADDKKTPRVSLRVYTFSQSISVTANVL